MYTFIVYNKNNEIKIRLNNINYDLKYYVATKAYAFFIICKLESYDLFISTIKFF